VRDTGVGIPSEQLDRIWGAFNQGSEGMARRFGGTLAPRISSPPKVPQNRKCKMLFRFSAFTLSREVYAARTHMRLLFKTISVLSFLHVISPCS
jgi:hypothetical protein